MLCPGADALIQATRSPNQQVTSYRHPLGSSEVAISGLPINRAMQTFEAAARLFIRQAFTCSLERENAQKQPCDPEWLKLESTKNSEEAIAIVHIEEPSPN